MMLSLYAAQGETKDVNISAEIKDTVTITIEISLKEVDQDLASTNMTLETVTQNFRDNGFDCK